MYVLYCAHLYMKYSLGVSNFLEEISILSHSVVFLYSLHWSLRKAFLTLLAILWNSAFKLVYLIFMKWSLVFPILLFSSISLHWSLRKAFLLLLDILWNSVFKWVYLSFFPFPFSSFLFSVLCKASSESHFAFLNLFFLGMILSTPSYTMPWTSIHRSSGTLSIRSNPLNLFVTFTAKL